MKSRLTSVGVLQSGKVLAVLYGAFAAIMAPFMFLATLFGDGGFFAGIFMIIFMIVIYPLMGFISGVISAFVYNFVAGIIGGIEITLEPVDEDFHLEDYRADEPATE